MNPAGTSTPDTLAKPDTPALAPAAATPRRKTSAVKKLLFAFVFFFGITLPIGCLTAEFALRIFAPQRLMPRYVVDSGFGIRVHAPNLVTHHTTGEYRIEIRTNSLGMRSDREFAFDKPAGVFRIVTLGDSFTMGYEVELEDSYPFRLEKLLNERGIQAEVINLGVSGFGTAEQLVMLQQRGLKFHPDMVVVGYYNNDLTDNTQSMLYALSDAGALVRKNDSYLPGVKMNNTLNSLAAYRWLTENSHLFGYLRENLSEMIQRRIRKSNAEQANLDDAGERKVTAALLDEIKRVANESGATFTLLQIPSMTNRSNLPADLLTRITPQEIVDLRSVQEQRWNDGLYWLKSDGHWNPRGQRLAAETLANAIEQRIRAAKPVAP